MLALAALALPACAAALRPAAAVVLTRGSATPVGATVPTGAVPLARTRTGGAGPRGPAVRSRSCTGRAGHPARSTRSRQQEVRDDVHDGLGGGSVAGSTGSATAGPRTYGNWRRPRGAGLGVLGPLGTGVLLVGAVLVIVVLAVAGPCPRRSPAAGGPAPGHARRARPPRPHRARRPGHAHRLVAHPPSARARLPLRTAGPGARGTCRLPGLLAAARLSEWADSYGRPFALLTLPATGHHTVVLATEPDGASLVDLEQVDSWVAHWGAWLATLGSEPGVVAAAVTVETAPDSGARLRAEVERAVDPRAPLLARTVLAEVARDYPAGSATVARLRHRDRVGDPPRPPPARRGGGP